MTAWLVIGAYLPSVRAITKSSAVCTLKALTSGSLEMTTFNRSINDQSIQRAPFSEKFWMLPPRACMLAVVNGDICWHDLHAPVQKTNR
jgi:hypothetical protein